MKEEKETGLILKLFEAAYMQRWNDKMRPMEFYELDKQAHKMMIAYFFASFEEDPETVFAEIIRIGIFEFLQRIVITDIKPPVFRMIKRDSDKYRKLNMYILSETEGYLELIGPDTEKEFLEYFTASEKTRAGCILSAAHTYSSMWEFNIIKNMNPESYDNSEIENDLRSSYERYSDLTGLRETEKKAEYRKFLQICGDLRYQSRWSHLHRIPKTSVLGHSLFVAWLAYYFSLKHGHCGRRIYNNFAGALFHDLPEALTRDIISPIKRSVEGMISIIREYEKEQMDKFIYPLLPEKVAAEIRMMLEFEFINRIIDENGPRMIENGDIGPEYNKDVYSPFDGELIKACDDTAAFIEAASAISNGCVSREFLKAKKYFIAKYSERGPVGGTDFSSLMERLDKHI